MDALRRMSSVSALSSVHCALAALQSWAVFIGKRKHAWQAHFHWLQFTKNNRQRSVWVCVCVVGMWQGRKCPAWTLPVWQCSLLARVTHFSSSILGSDKFLKDRIRADTDWPPVLSRTITKTMNTGQKVRLQTARSTNTERPRSEEASVTSSSTAGWFSQLATFRQDKFQKKKKLGE